MRNLWILLLLTMLIYPLGLHAQVRRQPGGRALDANPRTGGGGLNPSFDDGRVLDGQLLVDGQVTGLSGFRGDVPYRAPNELNLTLPGQEIRDFERRSVSVDDVRSGPTHVPRPWFDRRGTVLRGEAAAEGIPGSAVPYEAMQHPIRQDWGRLDQEVSAQVRHRWVLESQPAVDSPWGPMGASPYIEAPGQRFGLLREDDQWQLMRDLAAHSLRDDLRDQDERPGFLTADDTRRFRYDEPAERFLIDRRDERGDDVSHDWGRDVLTDLNRLLIDQRQDEALRGIRRGTPGRADGPGSWPAAGPAIGTPPVERLDTRPMIDPVEPGERTDHRPVYDAQVHVQDREDLPEIRLRTLAGAGQDPFNMTMRQAEQRLRAGQYYEAADVYGRAIGGRQGNPLAHVGRGVSLFAAGEPSAAAGDLRRAVTLLPELSHVQVDVTGLADEQVVRRRLQELGATDEELLEALRDQPAERRDIERTFLATFLLRNSGDAAAARAFAELLREAALAQDDAPMHRFASDVLEQLDRRSR